MPGRKNGNSKRSQGNPSKQTIRISIKIYIYILLTLSQHYNYPRQRVSRTTVNVFMVYFSNVSIRKSITHYSEYTNTHWNPTINIIPILNLQLSNIIKQIYLYQLHSSSCSKQRGNPTYGESNFDNMSTSLPIRLVYPQGSECCLGIKYPGNEVALL